MNFIESRDSDGKSVKLHYEDIGSGKPVVLIHGWPLDHQMWAYQLAELPKYGLRCIAYDRRGFGKSDKPWDGYNYDVLADDLKALLDQLDLDDVTLVGFSMGGGEVVRYFSRHGGARVSKVVLVSSVVPFTGQTDDNPDGLPPAMLQKIVTELNDDRAGFLATFAKQFYGAGLLSHPVSQQVLDWDLAVAMQASLKATLDCAHAFAETDFRSEMSSVSVPTLIIHGDADQTVPIKATSEQAADMIPDAAYYIYESAPHGLFITEKETLNTDIADFIKEEKATLVM